MSLGFKWILGNTDALFLPPMEFFVRFQEQSEWATESQKRYITFERPGLVSPSSPSVNSRYVGKKKKKINNNKIVTPSP